MFESNTLTLTRTDNGLARLHFDNKNASVNLFDKPTIADFTSALDVLEGADDIAGLLLTSGKGVFVAGADVASLERAGREGPDSIREFIGENTVNLNRLEDLPFPTVVAINGAALGGGFEVCLAADLRVMSERAVVGLPEVNFGIFPGWGGTVRLPRIIGLVTAAEWIVQGRPQKADAALAAGAVDEVTPADTLEDRALELLNECVAGSRDYQSRRAVKTSPLSDDAAAVSADLAELKNKLAGNPVPSPLMAVSSMERSALLPREAALEAELAAATDAVLSDEAGAMLGTFVSDQLLSDSARAWAKQAGAPVEKAAVLGAGIMGGGIAYVSALSGVETRMKDIVQEGIDAGMKEADSLLSKRVKRGQMSDEKKADVLSRIIPSLEYDGFDGADIVVEAVVENPKIKHVVLSEVEDKVSEDAIIASNTSTISITHLASVLKRPENFCGMHFFNPVHAMRLVEVIRGEKTSDDAVARTVAYAAAMGKKPIVVNDCPGFLVNRSLFPYLYGFSYLLRDGADFQQVDRVMEAWGWPMGPAYLSDVIGIDTLDHCEGVMAEGFPDRMERSGRLSLDIMAEAGRYGQKTGGGFYNYSRDANGRPTKDAADEADSLLEPHCEATRSFDDEEIAMRMMVPMATEMARILEDGIVENAYEADLGLLYGLGFPGFRGGVLRWMDTIGLETICEQADRFASLGKLYEPTDRMREMAASGGKFYG